MSASLLGFALCIVFRMLSTLVCLLLSPALDAKRSMCGGFSGVCAEVCAGGMCAHELEMNGIRNEWN